MHRSTVEVTNIARKTAVLLKRYLKIRSAYLFGSYAGGRPHSDSDIDLAFFSPSLNKMGIEEKITLISKVGEQVGSEVEIHLYSDKCLKEARPTNFYGYILKTGRRIV